MRGTSLGIVLLSVFYSDFQAGFSGALSGVTFAAEMKIPV